MKKVCPFVLFLLLSVLLVSGCGGGKDRTADVEITKKELSSNSTGKVIIVGKVKNKGSDEIGAVSLKADIKNEKGEVVDSPFEMVGPIPAGKEADFEITSSAGSKDAVSFDLKIESAQ